MLNPENLYFIDTPIEVQDSEYNNILESLNEIDMIDERDIVYLVFVGIYNMFNKRCFRGYIRTCVQKDKSFNDEPDFLIFIQ